MFMDYGCDPIVVGFVSTMSSVPITTKAHVDGLFTYLSDICPCYCFLCVLRFPPPISWPACSTL
jgi:hypothetical protein